MDKYLEIQEVRHRRKTDAEKDFFKSYKVFDGLGFFYFSTLKEANKYVINRQRVIDKSLEFALSQYHVVSKYYIENLVSLRVREYKGALINEYLQDCLVTIKYLTSKASMKPLFILPKTVYLLERYKYVTNVLNKPMLNKLVCQYLDTLLIDYPVFESKKYKTNENVKRQVKRVA